MVLMKYFCFYFPVRLGAIITSVMIAVANLVILGASVYYSADDVRSLAEGMRDKSRDNAFDTQAMEIYEILIDNLRDYSMECRWFMIAFASACIVTCLINIFAAVSKLRWLSVPYIFVVFIEISLVLTIHINYMLMKKKDWNLGVLIAASCTGGFFMLFLLYIWGVTVAMFQIIGVVGSKEYQQSLEQMKRQERNLKARNESRNVKVIAPTYYRDYNEEMLARDFYGVYRKNFRRI